MDGSYGKTMGPLSLMVISWPWPYIPSVHVLWPQHTSYMKIKKNKMYIKQSSSNLEIFSNWFRRRIFRKYYLFTLWKLNEDIKLLLRREYFYFLAIFFPSLTIRYTYRRNHHGEFLVSHWPISYEDHCPGPGITAGLDVKKAWDVDFFKR